MSGVRGGDEGLMGGGRGAGARLRISHRLGCIFEAITDISVLFGIIYSDSNSSTRRARRNQATDRRHATAWRGFGRDIGITFGKGSDIGWGVIFITIFNNSVLFGITYSNIFNATCGGGEQLLILDTQMRQHSCVVQR
jgi:hypothetical protein